MVRVHKKTFLIFIDNSFSTKAKTSRYVTNIDNIKNDAILAIENLNTKGNFKIITSSLDVNTDPLDKNKAINTIKQIESTYSEDNLSTYNFNIADYEQIFICDLPLFREAINVIENNSYLKEHLKHFDHHESSVSDNNHSFVNEVISINGLTVSATYLFYQYLQ